MDDVDDLVLDNIIRLCTAESRGRLACVCQRYKQAVRRVDRMHGATVVVKEYTYHQRIKWIRSHAPSILSCIATKVPLHRLPVLDMTNLRVLRLARINVNIRELLAIKHLPLKKLEMAHLTRCFYQIDRFQMSLLNHIPHISLSFDDTWNAAVLDNLGCIQTLQIRCRQGNWFRQPTVCIESVGKLEHLSVICHNKPRVDASVNKTGLRNLYFHCDTLRNVQPMYRLLGPYTHTLELHAKLATVSTRKLFAASPGLTRVRLRVMNLQNTCQPLHTIKHMSVFADMYISRDNIPQPKSLICPRIVLYKKEKHRQTQDHQKKVL
jgi:hypothetical protein